MTVETTNIPKLDAEALSLNSVSMWRTTWRRLFRRRSAVAGLIILGILTLIAITAPLIAPYDPTVSMLDADPPQRLKARTCSDVRKTNPSTLPASTATSATSLADCCLARA